MKGLVLAHPRFVLAASAAGLWVVASGMVMAATFGYREMRVAFDAVGLPIPQGAAPLIVHTIVRLLLGASVVGLYAIISQLLSPTPSLLIAAAFAWLLSMVLPYAVIAEWGLFPWSLAAKLWLWSAAELLIAGVIGRQLYRIPRAPS